MTNLGHLCIINIDDRGIIFREVKGLQRHFGSWVTEVLECVRFRPDRKAIQLELEAHYEDHVKDLERIGYDHDLARERALGAMGDPVEVGQALDKAHKPWLGWIWLASKWGFVICGVLLLCMASYTEGYNIRHDLHLMQQQADYEPDGYSLEPDNPAYSRAAVTQGGTVERSGYSISIPYAALWWNELEKNYNMVAILRTEDNRFWDHGPYRALQTLSMTDNTGGEFAAVTEWKEYTARERRERWDGFVKVSFVKENPFCSEYLVWVSFLEEMPEWTEFTCSSGEGFSLRLEWEVDTDG